MSYAPKNSPVAFSQRQNQPTAAAGKWSSPSLRLGLLVIILLAVVNIVCVIVAVHRSNTALQGIVKNTAATKETLAIAIQKLTDTESLLEAKQSALAVLNAENNSQERAEAELREMIRKTESSLAAEKAKRQQSEASLRETAQVAASDNDALATAAKNLAEAKQHLAAEESAFSAIASQKTDLQSQISHLQELAGQLTRQLADLKEQQKALPVVPTPVVANQKPTAVPAPITLPRSVYVLGSHGDCDCSIDGTNFLKLTPNKILRPGAMIRTGSKARADLFFRGLGTTIQLQEDTQIQIENLTGPLLDLTVGKILVVVHPLLPGNTLIISNDIGNCVIDAGTAGRYLIAADNLQKPEQILSRIPNKPRLPHAESKREATLLQLDEMEAVTEEAIAKSPSSLSPEK